MSITMVEVPELLVCGIQNIKSVVVENLKIIKELYKNLILIFKEIQELEIGNRSLNFLHVIANMLCSLIIFRIATLFFIFSRH